MSKTFRNVRNDVTSDEYRMRDSLKQSKFWAQLSLDALNRGNKPDAIRRLEISQRYFDTYASLKPEVSN